VLSLLSFGSSDKKKTKKSSLKDKRGPGLSSPLVSKQLTKKLKKKKKKSLKKEEEEAAGFTDSGKLDRQTPRSMLSSPSNPTARLRSVKKKAKPIWGLDDILNANGATGHEEEKDAYELPMGPMSTYADNWDGSKSRLDDNQQPNFDAFLEKSGFLRVKSQLADMGIVSILDIQKMTDGDIQFTVDFLQLSKAEGRQLNNSIAEAKSHKPKHDKQGAKTGYDADMFAKDRLKHNKGWR